MTVSISGTGLVAVTNATHDAYLNVIKGSVTQTGGILIVDKLILTNANGHFN